MREKIILIGLVSIFILSGCYALEIEKTINVGPLKKMIYTASLTTKDGEIELRREIQNQDKVSAEEWFNEIKNYLLSAKTNNVFYFIKDGKLYDFDKKTKTIRTMDIKKLYPSPEKFLGKNSEELKNIAMGKAELFYNTGIEPLNDDALIIISTNFDDAPIALWIYERDTKVISPVTKNLLAGKCGIYCGGPNLIKALNENEFILGYADGDACWRTGILYYFSKKENSAKRLLDYGGGCVDRGSFYIGIYSKDIFFGERKSLYTESIDTLEAEDQLLNLKKINVQTGEVSVLISDDQLPEMTTGVTLVDRGILLKSKKGYYFYDIEKNKIVARPGFEPKDEWSSQNDKQDENFEKYFNIKKEIRVVNEIKKGGKIENMDYEQIVDNEGDYINKFLEEKIEQADKQLSLTKEALNLVNEHPWKSIFFRLLDRSKIITGITVTDLNPHIINSHFGIYDLEKNTISFFSNPEMYVLKSADPEIQYVLLEKPFYYHKDSGWPIAVAYKVINLKDNEPQLIQKFIIDYVGNKDRKYGENIFIKILEKLNYSYSIDKNNVIRSQYEARHESIYERGINDFYCTKNKCYIILRITEKTSDNPLDESRGFKISKDVMISIDKNNNISLEKNE